MSLIRGTASGGITALGALLLAGACATTGATASGGRAAGATPELTERLGVVTIDAAGAGCLKIARAPFPARTAVTVVTQDPPGLWAAEIDGSCAAGDPDPSVVDGQPVPKQALRFPDGRPTGRLGIGVVGTVTRKVTQGEGPMALDLDGDGAPESFAQCTSTEGVHLTTWRGAPIDGHRLWHAYHYLGYDVEPTCKPAEM